MPTMRARDGIPAFIHTSDQYPIGIDRGKGGCFGKESTVHLTIDGRATERAYGLAGLPNSLKFVSDDSIPGKTLGLMSNDGRRAHVESKDTLRHGSRRVNNLSGIGNSLPDQYVNKFEVAAFSYENTPYGVGPPLRTEGIIKEVPPLLIDFSSPEEVMRSIFKCVNEQIDWLQDLIIPDTRGMCAIQRLAALRGLFKNSKPSLLGILMELDGTKQGDLCRKLAKMLNLPKYQRILQSRGYHSVVEEFKTILAKVVWCTFLQTKNVSRLKRFDTILDRNKWWEGHWKNPKDHKTMKSAIQGICEAIPGIESADMDFLVDAWDVSNSVIIPSRDSGHVLQMVLKWIGLFRRIFKGTSDRLWKMEGLIGDGNDAHNALVGMMLGQGLFLSLSNSMMPKLFKIAKDDLEKLGPIQVKEVEYYHISKRVVCDRVTSGNLQNSTIEAQMEIWLEDDNGDWKLGDCEDVGPRDETHGEIQPVNIEVNNNNTDGKYRSYYSGVLVLRINRWGKVTSSSDPEQIRQFTADNARRNHVEDEPEVNPFECFLTLPGFMRVDEGSEYNLGVLGLESQQLIHCHFVAQDNSGNLYAMVPFRLSRVDEMLIKKQSVFTMCFREMFENLGLVPGAEQHHHHNEHRQSRVRWWCERGFSLHVNLP